MTSTVYESNGHYYIHERLPNTIVFTPDNSSELIDAGQDWDDIHEGIMAWFVDEEGYATDCLVVSPFDKENPMSAEVRFVGEGIVMAKLQGYID